MDHEGALEPPKEGSGRHRVERRREQILRAALKVFGRRGYHPAQMDEVAQTAGVGKGTLYHHFESKEMLLREAISYLLDLHSQQLDQTVTQAADSIEKLFQVVRTDYTFIRSYRRLARVIFTEQTGLGHSSSFRASMLAAHEQRHQQLVTLMREGQTAGKLRSDISADFLASVFRGMVQELTSELVFREGPGRDADEVAEKVMRVFLEGAEVSSREYTDVCTSV